jgi:hypothetical protein
VLLHLVGVTTHLPNPEAPQAYSDQTRKDVSSLSKHEVSMPSLQGIRAGPGMASEVVFLFWIQVRSILFRPQENFNGETNVCIQI